MANVSMEAPDDGEPGRRETPGGKDPGTLSVSGGFGSCFPLFVKGVGAYGQVLTCNIEIMNTAAATRRFRRK